MTKPIQLAISTCPNDTFAFHAILNRKIDLQGLEFQIQLLDISRLNRGVTAGEFDVAKASFHTAIKLARDYCVLPSGAAIGFGNGPLLLAGRKNARPHRMSETTLCPGENTTATLLFRLFYGNANIEHVVFSEIMPALESGVAEYGVCIHEGRFTYEQAGLFLVEDLGLRWETETNCPLPLGGILARRTLPNQIISKIQSVISDSITYGLENRDETLVTMRQYAQEFSDIVLFKHVDLYVNQWTVDLGEQGQHALDHLARLAEERLGLSREDKLMIFGND